MAIYCCTTNSSTLTSSTVSIPQSTSIDTPFIPTEIYGTPTAVPTPNIKSIPIETNTARSVIVCSCYSSEDSVDCLSDIEDQINTEISNMVCFQNNVFK